MVQQPVKRLMALFFIILLLGTGACTPTIIDQYPLYETPPVEPDSTDEEILVEEEVQGDCFQSATALAWLDENSDGVRDEGEPPLPGIEFVLEPTVYSRTTSDENGIANIFATTPGDSCPENLKVVASRFEGYSLTTPGVLDYVDADTEYMFGFRSALLASPTSTAVP